MTSNTKVNVADLNALFSVPLTICSRSRPDTIPDKNRVYAET